MQKVERISLLSLLCEEIKKQPEFKNNPTARIDRDPPIIKKHIPDIFAKDSYLNEKAKVLILGEVKTKNDIRNNHTESQFLEYLEYLNNFKQKSFLYIGIPTGYVGLTMEVINQVTLQIDILTSFYNCF